MKYLLLFLILIFLTPYCKVDNTTDSITEVAIDSLVTEADTMTMELIKKDSAVGKVAGEHIERIKKGIEKSPYKNTSCDEIMSKFRVAVDNFCKGSLSLKDFEKEIPDIKDGKIKLCIYEIHKDEYDQLNEKVSNCIDEQERKNSK